MSCVIVLFLDPIRTPPTNIPLPVCHYSLLFHPPLDPPYFVLHRWVAHYRPYSRPSLRSQPGVSMTYRTLPAKLFSSQVRAQNACSPVCSTWSSSVGGNTGVGKETVKVRYRSPPRCCTQCLPSEPQQLLVHNAKVYLAARSAQKAAEAIEELKNETGKEAIFLPLDLSDIPAIRRSAREFLSYVVIRVSFS